MSKMAPLIGRSSTERLFLSRFAALCTDEVFYVRKACAANFGEFCAVIGTESTERVLVSMWRKFIRLLCMVPRRMFRHKREEVTRSWIKLHNE
jgi:serine/threonine-protein phosphatase 4 regulatory subunit 1